MKMVRTDREVKKVVRNDRKLTASGKPGLLRLGRHSVIGIIVPDG
jgi:hypothetical protein